MTPALNPEYLARLYRIINESPFPSHLPMRLTDMTMDTSRVELDIAECHMQPFGIVHGGVIATLVDTATFWAGIGPLAEDSGLVNVDLKLNYLESATQGRLVATGRRIRAGRTTSYTEAYVHTGEGRLIAHGTSTLMALPGKGIAVGVPKFL
ncbi:MAG TPA: PaaI family thioesterase [Gemmatimonadales bacterium]|nr:PaaI family thioesterase [Gemmatimonadales bacterium]